MGISFHSSVIFIQNMGKMCDFYTKCLDMEIEQDFGPCKIFRGGLSLWMLNTELAIAKKLGRTFSEDGNKNLELSFETEDFEKTLKKLKENNVPFLHDPVTEPWGQLTIRFYDPEGNLIEIGESIPTFVKRMHRSGMTEAEVAEQTGVPLKQVEEMIK